MAARTFKELQAQMSLEDFNRLCRKMAKEYANSTEPISKRVLECKYNITKSCCEKMLDYAVVNWLVGDNEVERMKERAKNNQKANSSSSGASSEGRYYRLNEERAKYLRNLAQEYVLCKDTPVEELAKKHGRTSKWYNAMMDIAIKSSKKYNIEGNLLRCIEKRRFAEKDSEGRCTLTYIQLSFAW